MTTTSQSEFYSFNPPFTTGSNGQFYLDQSQLLNYPYEEISKKTKLSDSDKPESDVKRQKLTDTRDYSYYTGQQTTSTVPPPQSLGSNSSPSSNESSSPTYPINQQYNFNFNDYNQKPFPTIIQTTVIDDLNRIDNVYIKKSKRDPIAEYDNELAESIEYELGLKKQNGPRKNSWGNLSYAELITRAIESSAEQRLTLSQIYDWIIKYVPYFKEKFDRTSSAGWKNSIRHNLSLHNRFIRVQNESSGKSSWWMINPDVSKYAINPTQDEIIDFKEKLKQDEQKSKKFRRQPNDSSLFDDKDKLKKSTCNKSKNFKKSKNLNKKIPDSVKTVKTDIDSPISTSPSNFANTILRTALQKPGNTPPTPSATPNYRAYNTDFYPNTYSSNLVDYSYQNGLSKSNNNQYYNYQCLTNQSYGKTSYMMPPVSQNSLYFNQNYKVPNSVSSPVSTASTTSTSSSYDLNMVKAANQSLPSTPTSLVSTTSGSVLNANQINQYDDFGDLFKSHNNNSNNTSTGYGFNQTTTSQNMTSMSNPAPIGCFYGN